VLAHRSQAGKIRDLFAKGGLPMITMTIHGLDAGARLIQRIVRQTIWAGRDRRLESRGFLERYESVDRVDPPSSGRPFVIREFLVKTQNLPHEDPELASVRAGEAVGLGVIV
jgi:hypothetical protein